MKVNNIISIFGATATGKTDVAHKIAEYLPIEIVNVDSIQVYKHLNIGSAKPDIKDSKIRYHLLDFLDLEQSYNSYDFLKDCKEIVPQIISRGNIPVLVGGSAFYFSTIFCNSPNSPKSDQEVRDRVNEIYKAYGLEYIYEDLVKNYKEKMAIHKNQTHRLKRAYEVHLQTGKFVSDFGMKKPDFEYKSLNIFLDLDRKDLYNRIDNRVDIMIKNGLIEEINHLKSVGYNQTYEGIRKGIGYKEFFEYDSIDEITHNIKLNTRHYAKRQITFFNKIDSVKFLPYNFDSIFEHIKTVFF